MNQFRVWILMAALTGLLVVIGNALGGASGSLAFFVMAILMNGATYYYSDKIAIAMTRSQPLPEREAPEIHEMIARLSAQAGMPKPAVYRTPSPQPNAFATGRNPAHAAVSVTDGLLRLLDRREVEGVLAHEIAHIRNRDTLVGTVAATMAGAITMLASVARWGLMFAGPRHNDDRGNGGSAAATLVMVIVAPIAAALIQMAISRSREYLADSTGAQLAGNPEGLARALEKLEAGAHRVPMEVSPAASHLFIVNPLSGQALLHLFSTHPPIAERVRRLRQLSPRS